MASIGGSVIAVKNTSYKASKLREILIEISCKTAKVSLEIADISEIHLVFCRCSAFQSNQIYVRYVIISWNRDRRRATKECCRRGWGRCRSCSILKYVKATDKASYSDRILEKRRRYGWNNTT